MSRKTWVVGRIESRVSFRGCDRLVRLVKTDKQEERLVWITLVGKPSHRFLRDQVGGVALQRADVPAVADEIDRIAVVRQRVVLRGEPVIEAMVGRLRLRRSIELTVEVPLARMARVVAGLTQNRGDRDFGATHMHRRQHRNPVVDADAKRRSPGHQPRARRRTVGRRGVARRQLESLSRKSIETWRGNAGVAVAGQIAVAQVVGQHDHKVRLGPVGGSRRHRPQPRLATPDQQRGERQPSGWTQFVPRHDRAPFASSVAATDVALDFSKPTLKGLFLVGIAALHTR